MNSGPAIVWFRQDLRLADNPALQAATKRGGSVIPLFIWAPEEEGEWPPGAASRWWLHQSLAKLDEELRSRGTALVIRRGPTLDALQEIVSRTGATALFWNRRYEPAIIQRDRVIQEHFCQSRLAVESFNGSLLVEPWAVQNQSGNPFQVFTPFWKKCLNTMPAVKPMNAPLRITGPAQSIDSLSLRELKLEPALDWAGGLRSTWRPGEAEAARLLRRFCKEGLADYSVRRDLPAVNGTTRLSPHLHFGEISPRQIWHHGHRTLTKSGAGDWSQTRLAAELGWREFAHHLLFHFPHLPNAPLREKFASFPWRENPESLRAWQKGRTGYPLVDAGMRELWTSGWMHNRVRMVTASFLVKHLLLPWQAGARWFWDTLVDADLANNTLGWQWTAGCGADAAPFFRIFNPVNQGERFDPEGDYIRRWVPELARMPSRWIHQPWRAPSDVLASAGVRPGDTYPEPIVKHESAREAALKAYEAIQ